MSSIDPDVNINLNAQDNASPVIDNSVKNIDRSFVQMRNGMRANERSFYLQHQSIFKLNQVMGNLRTITGAGINIMNTMLLTQIRNQAAAKNLRDALRDQSDAFAEFGPNSREFTDAQERVNEVIKEQKDQVLQDTIAWVQMGLYLTSTILPLLIKISSRMRSINRTPMMTPGSPALPSIITTPGSGTTGSGRFGKGLAAIGTGFGVAAVGAIGADVISEGLNIQPYQNSKGETWWQENIESLFKPTVVVNINNNSQGIYGP